MTEHLSTGSAALHAHCHNTEQSNALQRFDTDCPLNLDINAPRFDPTFIKLPQKTAAWCYIVCHCSPPKKLRDQHRRAQTTFVLQPSVAFFSVSYLVRTSSWIFI